VLFKEKILHLRKYFLFKQFMLTLTLVANFGPKGGVSLSSLKNRKNGYGCVQLITVDLSFYLRYCIVTIP
jgi:hypothetical protein